MPRGASDAQAMNEAWHRRVGARGHAATQRTAPLLLAAALLVPTTGCITISLHNSVTPQANAGAVTGVLAWRNEDEVQIGVFYERSEPRAIGLQFVAADDEGDPAMTLAEWRSGVDPGLEEVPVLQRMPLSKQLTVVVWSREEDRVRVCRGERCHPGPNLYCWPKDTTEKRLDSGARLATPIAVVFDIVTFPYQLYLWGSDKLPERIEPDCP